MGETVICRRFSPSTFIPFLLSWNKVIFFEVCVQAQGEFAGNNGK